MPSLGMNRPSVNKSILNKLNQIKRGNGYQQLVKCPPSCLIHVCHNSFKKGIAKYGYIVEELCLNLYYVFKTSSHWCQDLSEVEESPGHEELILLHNVQHTLVSLTPPLE